MKAIIACQDVYAYRMDCGDYVNKYLDTQKPLLYSVHHLMETNNGEYPRMRTVSKGRIVTIQMHIKKNRGCETRSFKLVGVGIVTFF